MEVSSQKEGKSLSYRILPSVRGVIVLLVNMNLIGAGFCWSVMGFAMTCMVNSTDLHSSSSQSTNRTLTCGGRVVDEHVIDYGGTFHWDKTTQSSLLASCVWGGLLLLLPGGWLMDRYGAKKVVGACNFALMVGMWVSPVATIYGGPWALFAVRIVIGAFGSLLWVSMYAITYRWIPKSEVGMTLGVAATGVLIGEGIGMATAGMLCESSWGWPSIFYSQAFFVTSAFFFWLLIYTDQPEKAWLISEQELQYILASRPLSKKAKVGAPWLHILRSVPVLATVLSHFGGGFINAFVISFLPFYFKQVLLLNARSNGFFASLAYLTQSAGRLISGPLSDLLNRCLSPTNVVKLFNTVCMGGPALCLLAMGFLDCSSASLAIVLISTSNFTLGTTTAGYGRAYALIAPRFSSSISSVGQGAAMIAGVVVNYSIGAIVTNQPANSTAGWHQALFINVGVAALCCLAFLLFGSGDEQSWAVFRNESEVKETNESLEMTEIKNGTSNNGYRHEN